MTRDELDTLWHKALVMSVCDNELYTRYHFAALVAKAEREACAKVCDDLDLAYEGDYVLATWCATAIRARGEV